MPAFGITPSVLGAWRKNVQGVYNSSEGMTAARDVGFIRSNYSRLNVISSLTKGDNENWFKINVQSSGSFRLTVRHSSSEEDSEAQLSDGQSDYDKVLDSFRAAGIRVEVHKKTARGSTVIASNDEAKEKEFEAFEKMMYGEYRFQQKDKGEYFVRVSRIDTKNNKSTEFVALQMQMGDYYRHDYTSVEVAVDQSKDPGTSGGDINALLSQVKQTSSMLSMQGASQIISAGLSNASLFSASNQQSSIFGSSIYDILGSSGSTNIFDILASRYS